MRHKSIVVRFESRCSFRVVKGKISKSRTREPVRVLSASRVFKIFETIATFVVDADHKYFSASGRWTDEQSNSPAACKTVFSFLVFSPAAFSRHRYAFLPLSLSADLCWNGWWVVWHKRSQPKWFTSPFQKHSSLARKLYFPLDSAGSCKPLQAIKGNVFSIMRWWNGRMK